MRVLGLLVAGVLVLTTPIVGEAAPSGSTMKQLIPAGDVVQIWGGCGWGWHPVPGHWSRWRGGWVPSHCAPNRYYRGWDPYGAWQGAYGGWRPHGDWGSGP